MEKKHFEFQYRHSKVTIISDLPEAKTLALHVLDESYATLDSLIAVNNDWKMSFDPIISGRKEKVILLMEEAAKITQVGPMAAVAGAIADLIVETLISKGAKIAVVENGGEIAVQTDKDIHIGMVAHTSFLKSDFGFLIKGGSPYFGIGTSSGQSGHAISLGESDLVTVFAENAAISDAAGTAIANEVLGEDCQIAIERGIKKFNEMDHQKIHGVILNRKDKIGMVGKIPEITKIKKC